MLNTAILNILKELKEAESQYRHTKQLVAKKEASLYAYTNFKEIGCTNKEQRDGWVTDKLIPFMEEENYLDKQVKFNHLQRLFKAYLEAPEPAGQYDDLIRILEGNEGEVQAHL